MPGENTNGNGFGVDATTGPRPQETVACSDPEGATCSPMCFKETDAGPDADSWPHSARSDQTLVHVPARPTDATDSLSSKNCEPKPDSSADLDELRTLDRGSAGPPALPTMAMPRVGCEFLGFRLLAELGAGTFGRVYLGTPGEVGRPACRFEDRSASVRRIADACSIAAQSHRADLLGTSGGSLPGSLHAFPRHHHASRSTHGSASGGRYCRSRRSTSWTRSRPGLVRGLAAGRISAPRPGLDRTMPGPVTR